MFNRIFFHQFNLQNTLFYNPKTFSRPSTTSSRRSTSRGFQRLVRRRMRHPRSQTLLTPTPRRITGNIRSSILVNRRTARCSGRPTRRLIPLNRRLFRAPIPHIGVSRMVIHQYDIRTSLHPRVRNIRGTMRVGGKYTSVGSLSPRPNARNSKRTRRHSRQRTTLRVTLVRLAYTQGRHGRRNRGSIFLRG